jgi:hypothetical protein
MYKHDDDKCDKEHVNYVDETINVLEADESEKCGKVRKIYLDITKFQVVKSFNVTGMTSLLVIFLVESILVVSIYIFYMI